MEGTWWKEGVVYQIYPRSFRDSNADGIGDLNGIIEKLDYIASLGVTIVWLNPVFKSPNEDNGYDISDYEDIMEEFGTMADFQLLLDGMHERGMRLIMDLVVNHTSSAHSWFREARSSKENSRRNFYLWKKGKDGLPPNNWRSCFGGSAWELDEASGEYYLHLFVPGQPDLNWENPAVRSSVFSMMRRWFDRGIDGFRMDTINLISKDPSFRDLEPGESMFAPSAPYVNGPRVHEYLAEMNREVLSRYDSMSVGECPGTTPETALDYVGKDRHELNMLFQFELMDIDHVGGDKWKQKPISLPAFKRCVERWQVGLQGRGWNSNFLMNHDQPRSVSRFGNDGKWRVESARTLIMHMMTLGGTPYLYQGDEIGMTNVVFPGIQDYRDVDTLNHWAEAIEAGEDPKAVLASIHYMSRDNSRTPMQWDSSANAGFSSGKPWIALNPNYPSINVGACESDGNSVLNFTRRMIRFRKAHPVLAHGSFTLLDPDEESSFSYLRDDGKERLFVILNFSDSSIAIANRGTLEPLMSDYGATELPGAEIPLRPWEGRIYTVK